MMMIMMKKKTTSDEPLYCICYSYLNLFVAENQTKSFNPVALDTRIFILPSNELLLYFERAGNQEIEIETKKEQEWILIYDFYIESSCDSG